MSKTISKKLLYIVVALAMLAMMIPAMAVPISAAGGTITMTLVDPISGALVPDFGYDVAGSTVNVAVTGDTVSSWTNTDWGTSVSTPIAGAVQFVQVSGVSSESTITAHMTDNTTLSVDKKWANNVVTSISTAPGSYSPVVWSEANKSWSGTATVTDVVTGTFVNSTPAVKPVQGAILNWYLVRGDVAVSMAAGEAPALKNYVSGLNTVSGPSHVLFADNLTTWRSVSDGTGSSQAIINASGEEAVQVVIIPEYPGDPQIVVTPEVASYDFYTTENEVVPQVRWAGEKIVLEKNFGTTYSTQWVKFDLQNQSIGSLEGIVGRTNFVNATAVWTQVDDNGTASVILVGTDPGVANVTAALYARTSDAPGENGQVINQHFFTVYFLKFESLTLGDVQGKRDGHNTGLWTLPSTVQPTNPWDPTGSYNGTVNPPIADNVTQTLNVSQDALLRAQVRGWFTSSNPTSRPATTIPGTILVNPAGRWILPDDWAALAGPNWKQSRLHWDIMCNPDGSVGATDILGDYYMPPLSLNDVAVADVIGPFSPGLELMTPTGWQNIGWDSLRDITTVVPDGKLNVWDAPMPSAKIIFQIQSEDTLTAGSAMNEAGYFKAASKADIYYILVTNPDANIHTPIKVYTNPFYEANIPAHEAIPPFINNGGYDWDSFGFSGAAYGPYMFWEFINQTQTTPMVPTTDPSGHPTSVEVYSDNHGEAMVWLNGNWNLDLTGMAFEGSTADVQIGDIVGTTTIQATADYPYSRLHQAIQSNMDVKTWLWGGQVLGTDSHTYSITNVATDSVQTRMVLSVGTYLDSSRTGVAPNEVALSAEKMVWVWVTDRDGMMTGVNGARVDWNIATNTGSTIRIDSATGKGISGYNVVTQNIYLNNGFLAGTNGVITDGAARLNAYSYLIPATSSPYLVQLFNKFWGPTGTSSIKADPADYCVAAIKVDGGANNYTSRAMVNIQITSHDFDQVIGQAIPGINHYETDVILSQKDALDDGITAGDANCDGVVNMGDVTAAERMILGIDPVTSNAVLNGDGVDMGTVVKIERKILGY